MSDLGLEVSENRLKEHVLLFDDLFVVQQLLHLLVVPLVGKHGQSLQLVLILLVVEDGLRDDDVRVDLGVKCSEGWPVLSLFESHCVQHQLFVKAIAHVINVLPLHRGKQSLLPFFEVFQFLLRGTTDLAD